MTGAQALPPTSREATALPTRAVGVLMLGAVVMALVAIAMPVWGVYGGTAAARVAAIAGEVALFVTSVVIWIAAYVLGAVAVAALSATARRSIPADPRWHFLAGLAAPLFGASMAGYVLAKCVSTPILVAAAQHIAPPSAVTMALLIDHAIWEASSAAGIIGIALLAVLLARGGSLPAWTGLVFGAWAVIAAALLALTGDLPPFLFFLLTLPAPAITAFRRRSAER